MFFPIIVSGLLTKLAEVSHDLTCHWEWNHVCLAVHHHPRKHRKKKKARQEEESKKTKQEQRPSMEEKVLHTNLPSTSSLYHLQSWLLS